MTNTISAADNPVLANNLIQDALAEQPQQVDVQIISPSDTYVRLPGGYINATGELVQEAEVRELNGRDEEAISRATSIGKSLSIILQRGVVRVGSEKATEEILDRLLTGDRDMLLLSILKVTFGKETETGAYCSTCDEVKSVSIDIDNDIKVKALLDPVDDRTFLVQGKSHEFTVKLPTGVAQKEMMNSTDKTQAELNTILLENTVTKIDSMPVVGKAQVQNIGLVDRKKIIDEIDKRVPGPRFEPITLECPDCGSEVVVPINLGNFFQF